MYTYIYTSIYISERKIDDCLIYCILSNGEVIKYHKFISALVIELSVSCLNTGSEDRLTPLLSLSSCLITYEITKLIILGDPYQL